MTSEGEGVHTDLDALGLQLLNTALTAGGAAFAQHPALLGLMRQVRALLLCALMVRPACTLPYGAARPVLHARRFVAGMLQCRVSCMPLLSYAYALTTCLHWHAAQEVWAALALAAVRPGLATLTQACQVALSLYLRLGAHVLLQLEAFTGQAAAAAGRRPVPAPRRAACCCSWRPSWQAAAAAEPPARRGPGAGVSCQEAALECCCAHARMRPGMHALQQCLCYNRLLNFDPLAAATAGHPGLLRAAGLLHEVYLNLDCRIERSNLFEGVCALLSKTAFPVNSGWRRAPALPGRPLLHPLRARRPVIIVHPASCALQACMYSARMTELAPSLLCIR